MTSRECCRLPILRKSNDARAAVRFGLVLLPEIYAVLKTAATDQDRQRLTALRYRAVLLKPRCSGRTGSIAWRRWMCKSAIRQWTNWERM